ncbi:hypothetical protein P8452_52548 [Trifolium repens]|nr:hypothetical protein P8452_52548 [Trifolium repens]
MLIIVLVYLSSLAYVHDVLRSTLFCKKWCIARLAYVHDVFHRCLCCVVLYMLCFVSIVEAMKFDARDGFFLFVFLLCYQITNRLSTFNPYCYMPLSCLSDHTSFATSKSRPYGCNLTCR